ncbi:hypothetical protein EV361DRAFT_901342 [Lentinula raphanica]|nr:hypothetical protein EV361DRAFT_901342 [Lentinula raphanica]
MASQASEDEYDQLPDDLDFGAIGDDEWNSIQTQNPTTQRSIDLHGEHAPAISHLPREPERNDISEPQITITVPEFVQGSSTLRLDSVLEHRRIDTPSNGYFSDETDDLDDAFLERLNEVENQLINRPTLTVPPSTASTVPSEPSCTPEALPCNVHNICSPSLKRPRPEDHNEDSTNPLKKSKGIFKGDWTELLNEYDDEINCPICCDILVAAHLVNGCGHTLCGSCGYQWIVEKHRNTCPICRAKCHALTPLIPNITADNFVNKHIQVRAMLGDEDWKPGGSSFLEWQMRKDKWKKDCERRAERSKKVPPITIRPRVDNLVGQLAFMNELIY